MDSLLSFTKIQKSADSVVCWSFLGCRCCVVWIHYSLTLSWCYSKLLNTGNMRTSSMCLNILSCESLSVVGQKIKMTHAEVFPGSRALHESAAWVIMPMSTRKSSISLLVLPLCLLEWGEALSRASETHSLQHKAEHYIKIMVHNQCALIRGFIVTKAANNMSTHQLGEKLDKKACNLWLKVLDSITTCTQIQSSHRCFELERSLNWQMKKILVPNFQLFSQPT